MTGQCELGACREGVNITVATQLLRLQLTGFNSQLGQGIACGHCVMLAWPLQQLTLAQGATGVGCQRGTGLAGVIVSQTVFLRHQAVFQLERRNRVDHVV